MKENRRKQWRKGQPVLVANSRVTYPVGDRRRSLSPGTVPSLKLPPGHKSRCFELPEEISKVSLTTDLPEPLANIWIPCWYSYKHNSLFWIEDSNVSDLQPSFYNPMTLNTMLLRTVDKLGLSTFSALPPARRRSWGDASTLDRGKENQTEYWMVGYLSGLFDKRSPSQKVFVSPHDARSAGIRSVIPIFVDPGCTSDMHGPSFILPTDQCTFYIPLSSQGRKFIVDSTGIVISVTFKNNLVEQQRDVDPSITIFSNCRHFHSEDDIVALKSILLTLNFEDSSSLSEWVPIVQKDSSLLIRELLQILLRVMEIAEPRDYSHVIFESSVLLRLCWRIDPFGAMCNQETDAFFRILSSSLLNASFKFPNVSQLLSITEYILRQTPIESSAISFSWYTSLIDFLVPYLISSSVDDPIIHFPFYCLLSTLWFRNILGLISNVDSTSPAKTYCLHQQLISLHNSNPHSVVNTFGSFSDSHICHTLAALIPPVCVWLTQTFSMEISQCDDKLYSLRFLTSSLTLLLIVQNSTQSSAQFFPDWELIHNCLNFLLHHRSEHKALYFLPCVQTMIQLVDFLQYLFVNLEWLQMSYNRKMYRDTILQILEECVESLETLQEEESDCSIEISDCHVIYSGKLITLLSRCYDFDDLPREKLQRKKRNS